MATKSEQHHRVTPAKDHAAQPAVQGDQAQVEQPANHRPSMYAAPSTSLGTANIVALQRTIGNQAVSRRLAQATQRQAANSPGTQRPGARRAAQENEQASGVAASNVGRPSPTHDQSSADGVIQRSVGFEFEIDQVTTYKKNILNKPTDLAKKDVLLKGAGFKVEADEMPGHSNMEFVTDAFPESPDGGMALAGALGSIDQIINTLTANVNTEVPAATLNAFGTPVTNRFIRPNAAPFIGKPQVTAGIKLDAMDRFFRDIGSRAIAAGDATTGNNAARMIGGQLTPNAGQREATTTSTGMLDVSQARAAAVQALADVNAMVGANPANPVIGGPEMIALVTQLVMYLVRGAVGSPGYGKLISGGLMGRTDFAAMFKLLPQAKQDYLSQNPNTFVHLVISAAGAAHGHNISVSGPVFEGGLYNDPGMYGNDPNFQADLLPELKRDAWLRGIATGRDLLTAENYPGKRKQKQEIESLGGYGDKTDNLSTDPRYQTPAPIVELRGLKPLYAGLFMPMALDLFRYIHTVNTGGVEDYPGQLLDLGINDRMDLIQNQGAAAAVRQRLVQEALDEIEWWA